MNRRSIDLGTDPLTLFRGRQGVFVFVFCLLGLCSSCYHPDYGMTHYKCDPAALGSDCPVGYSCINSFCEQPDAGSADQNDDLSVSMTSDLAGQMQDLGAAQDLARQTPDLQSLPDLKALPCATSGTQLTMAADIWACRGNFPAGGYGALCGGGFHVCTLNDISLFPEAVGTCRMLPSGGFYAADVEAGLYVEGVNNKVDCPRGGRTYTKALVGCGSEPGSMAVMNDCHKLKDIMPCGIVNAFVNCTMGLADAVRANSTNGGVLCCKN